MQRRSNPFLRHREEISQLEGQKQDLMTQLSNCVATHCSADFIKMLMQPYPDEDEHYLEVVTEQAFYSNALLKPIDEAYNLIRSSHLSHWLNAELPLKIAQALAHDGHTCTCLDRAKQYKQALLKMCETLLVKTYVELIPVTRLPSFMSSQQSTIVIRLDKRSENCTVKDAIDAVSKFCEVAKIPLYLSCIHEMKLGCIVIHLLVPKYLVTQGMKNKMKKEQCYFKEEKFVQLEIDQEIVFNFTHDMVWCRMNMCPLLRLNYTLHTKSSEWFAHKVVHVGSC